MRCAIMLGAVILAGPTLLNAEEAGLAPYLVATATIDSDNPRIVETARRLTKDRSSPIEQVRALYEFVRDGNTEADCASFTASASPGSPYTPPPVRSS